MKRLMIVLPVLMLLLGCAVKSDLAEGRSGNTVTYALPDSDDFVTFTVGGDFVYERPFDKEFMGLGMAGYLFSSGDGCRLLVTKVPRDGFEDLIGRDIQAPAKGTKTYEPRTAYLGRLCRLARFYIVSLGTEVAGAIKIKSFKHGETCLGWEDLEELTARHPEMVETFNKSGDQAVSIEWH